MAHFTGWSYNELITMPMRDLAYWYFEAVNLHNKMNAPPDK